MKVKKSILIICAVIILCTLIEIITKGVITSTKNYIETKKEEKIKQEEYNTPVQKNKRSVESYMNEIINMVEQKDYDKIYESLDKDYLDYKFQGSKEKMIKYIEENFANKKLSFVLAKGSSRIVSCLIGIQDGEKYTSNYMNVTIDDEGNATSMMFDDYRNFDKVNYTQATSVAKYSVIYSFLANDNKDRIAEIKITNISNNLLSISLEDFVGAQNNDRINKNLEIPADGEVSFELRMSRRTSINTINLVGTENGEPLNIMLDYLTRDDV